MEQKRTPTRGRCFCGHVQFETSQAPSSACHCHCESCQRASGAPYLTWVQFPIESFTVIRGTLIERQSSPDSLRGHCAHCGTTMTYRSERFPGEIDVTATCLDVPGAVIPDRHIWTEDKQPWVIIDDDLPCYERWSPAD